ncbi:hypothetical protein U8V72_20945 [Priestia filamentosa]|uniref:hypothetical protein n=1 Tax=Priestia filamentosa TaxID=1402861 RepID=UPI0012E082CD
MAKSYDRNVLINIFKGKLKPKDKEYQEFVSEINRKSEVIVRNCRGLLDILDTRERRYELMSPIVVPLFSYISEKYRVCDSPELEFEREEKINMGELFEMLNNQAVFLMIGYFYEGLNRELLPLFETNYLLEKWQQKLEDAKGSIIMSAKSL